MKRLNRPIRRSLWLSVGLAVGLVATMVTPAVYAATQAGSKGIGPGYPKPGGIYTPFTNCPVLHSLSLMSQSVSGDATACVAGEATSGTIKIGNITTQVVYPVTAQFGAFSAPNSTPTQFSTLPPPSGVSAELKTSPDFVPGGLLQALGCPSKNSVIEAMCKKAKSYGGNYLNVYALAEEALPVTNFAVFSWTQPIMIRLINPLLGSDCSIGSPDNPITVNPQLSGGSLEELLDPNPKAHPNTAVLELEGTTASDSTFSAPEILGCGPGGAKDIPVDEQLDSYTGLPSASGSNSLSLTGNFFLADCYNSVNQAKILLAAIEASHGVPPSDGSSTVQSLASLKGHYGIT
jgi:hypothetical protein